MTATKLCANGIGIMSRIWRSGKTLHAEMMISSKKLSTQQPDAALWVASAAGPSFSFASVVLFLSAIVVFLPAILFPFITLDDASYVYENANVSSGLSIKNLAWAVAALHANISYWHPLT